MRTDISQQRVDSQSRQTSRFKPYPQYKESGVEWMGKIPGHWYAVPVKRIALRIQTGSTPPTASEEYYENGEIPWFGPASFSDDLVLKQPAKLIARIAVRDRVIRLFDPGSTMIVTIGATIGKVGYLESFGSANQQITGITCNLRNVTPKFVAYQLKCLEPVLRGIAPTTTLPILDQQEVGYLAVAIPSLQEQRLIIDFLDRETVMIDALVAKKERLIELLQEKRSALISHAVTKGLNPNAPMRDSKIGWIGSVPEHWIVAPVYARYEVQLGKMLDSKNISGDHLAPYLRNVDVQWDRINTENLPEMDFSQEDKQRFPLVPGDLLVCEGGEVGRTAIWRGQVDECYYQKAIHRLRPRRSTDAPRFFLYVMMAGSRATVFHAMGNSNTIDHLTAEKLRLHRFAYPPGYEQEHIAEFLDSKTTEIDKLIAKVSIGVEVLKEYRAALISAAVTGKIDVRSSSEEEASCQ